MFTGFGRGAFEYFMALSFNNNREFFHSNHDWYETSVRAPLAELCMDLAPTLLEIDPELEVRPKSVVSHINRDLRYSKDKSPYRDYMWLGFHRAGWDKSECFHLYFDIGANAAHIGAGMYGGDKRWTDALRAFIRTRPAEAEATLDSPAVNAFALGGDVYKRLSLPEGLPKPLDRWYPRKNFYLEHTYSPEELFTQALTADIAARFKSLKPIYDFMYLIKPPADAGVPESAGEANFKRISSKAAYAPDTPDW